VTLVGWVVPGVSKDHSSFEVLGFLHCSTLSFRMFGTTCAVTQHHLPEDLNPQAHPCKNVRSQKYVVGCELLQSEIDSAEVVLG
jgi:hypothetical protein